ncbi:endolytic transglycosylase MltG [Solihabitans fulvus]|uniref:endolytic transglycosylase MltG n=1 Tax=Solihabitans fulvus TaxID=1892852 RepID=UPI001661E743|nr:endolytic transglycosylase MltG [Solihabitans fulvus]
MNDDLGLFEEAGSDTADAAGTGREGKAKAKGKPARKVSSRNKKLVLLLVGLLVLVVVGGGAWYGVTTLLGIGSYDDYPGGGDSDKVIQVQSGDSTGDIATRLKDADVVASARAFVKAGETVDKLREVQPGYYLLKTKMSGTAAVAKIVDPASKVQALEVKGGNILADHKVGDKVVPGILSMLSQASCATLDGKKTCVPVEQLQQAAQTADAKAIGVPDWAMADVARAEPKHRLEGLIMPGIYQVKPGASAEELLKNVLASSSALMQVPGLPAAAADTGFRPYQILIMASLVEKEAITDDFGKVSRVIYNRLSSSTPLGLDSTTNYQKDQPDARLTDAELNAEGPYNTRLNKGLPPTPIGSPSSAALTSAMKPEAGDWLFFVKCKKDGHSCFNTTQAGHDKDANDAKNNGVF